MANNDLGLLSIDTTDWTVESDPSNPGSFDYVAPTNWWDETTSFLGDTLGNAGESLVKSGASSVVGILSAGLQKGLTQVVNPPYVGHQTPIQPNINAPTKVSPYAALAVGGAAVGAVFLF